MGYGCNCPSTLPPVGCHSFHTMWRWSCGLIFKRPASGWCARGGGVGNPLDEGKRCPSVDNLAMADAVDATVRSDEPDPIVLLLLLLLLLLIRGPEVRPAEDVTVGSVE